MSNWLLATVSRALMVVFLVLIATFNVQAQNIIQIKLDPLLYATRTLEKTIQFSVTNTGSVEIKNIALKTDELGDNYIITPSKISSLMPGEEAEAALTFTPSNLTDTEFYITASSGGLYTKEKSRLILLEIKEYFTKELNDLEAKKVERCSDLLKKLQLHVDNERFINAKAVLEQSHECVESESNKPSYFIWTIALFIVILVLISGVFVIRKIRSFKEDKGNSFDLKIKEIREKLK